MKTFYFILLFSALFSGVSYSQNIYDVRSLSMGNTGVSNSYDIDALNNNPANILKQRTNNKASSYFSVLTNFNFHVNSGFFSFDFYDKYFTTNSVTDPIFLSDQDKATIISEASGEKVNISAMIKYISLVFNINKFGAIGISLDDRGAGNFTVSRDPLELGLYGNQINRIYDFAGTGFKGTWIRQLNLTYAKNFKPKKSKIFEDLSFGISVKPQFGQFFGSTDRNDLTITTNNNLQVRGTGGIEFLFAGTSADNVAQLSLTPAGFGVGFDFGINAGIKNISKKGQMNVGLSLNDLGYIKWTKNANRYVYNGNYIVTDITDPAQLDSLNKIVKGTKVNVPDFNTTLPLNLRLGITYKIFSKPVKEVLKNNDLELANISLEYLQGFYDDLGFSKKPAVGLGAEINATNVISPRIGLVLGGTEEFAVNFGLGIDTGPVLIDLGTYNFSSLFSPKSSTKFSGGLSIKYKVN